MGEAWPSCRRSEPKKPELEAPAWVGVISPGERMGPIGSEQRFDQVLELDDGGGKLADAFGGLLGGHGVFVESEAEGLFVERDFLEVRVGRGFRRECAGQVFGGILQLLEQAGWERVPESDWRWILQALNPDPDQASLPLLGRAYQGRSEELLMRKKLESKGRMLTVRLWDSGVRLLPGRQVLYLGQLSEEQLVQRFGLFSYWRSVPGSDRDLRWVREALGELDQKVEHGDLLLLRE